MTDLFNLLDISFMANYVNYGLLFDGCLGRCYAGDGHTEG